MIAIWNPNLLAAAGIIIIACGLGLFAKAMLSAVSGSIGGSRRAVAQTRVDLAFAAPILLLGLVTLAAAQFVASGLNPALTTLLLATAFALLLYALGEGSLVERALGVPAEAAPQRLKLIAPSPAPIMVADSPIDVSASALPAEPRAQGA